MIGTTLSHYRITSKLGEGGMGTVYLAEDTRLDREVALKVLPAELASDPERLQRFEREAKSIAALKHQNIVTIYSVEEVAGVRFLTMEWVEGKTLDEHIPAGGLSLPELFELAIPMADALAEAHAKGITHRDLKPANVMVTPKGQVKVLDFGLAKLAEPDGLGDADETSALTQDGLVVGTVRYMSPEQARGEPADHRSDVFSLGVLLFEMATGERPFRGNSTVELLSSILRDDPMLVTEAKADLPNHLGRIVQRCLEKDSSRRYQSAMEIHNELESLRREVDSGSRQTAATHTDASTAPKLRLVWVAVAALILVAVVRFATRWDEPAGSQRADGSAETTGLSSIAVLPFQNLSADPSNEYFSDGMTEEIITRLSKTQNLQVVSRSASFRYKGQLADPRQVARELGVQTVVAGGIRREGDRVRVSAQLIDASNGFEIWSESYDRTVESSFEIQDEVAIEIARALRLSLGDTGAAAGQPRDLDPEAYEHYSRARHEFYKYTVERNETAIELYERALAVDPDYALALAGLSLSQSQYINRGWSDDVSGWLAKAEANSRRAVELDPESAEANFALGFVAEQRRDYPEMERLMRRVLHLNPNHAHAHDSLADALVRGKGLLDEGIAEYDIALRLDPFLIAAYIQKGRALEWSGRFAEARASYEQVFAFSPNNDWPHQSLGWLELLLGNFTKAEASFRAALALAPGQLGHNIGIARALIGQGKLEEAAEVGNALSDPSSGVANRADELNREIGARIALKTGQPERAVREYDRLLAGRLDPLDDYSDIVVELARAMIMTGDAAGAVEALRTAIAEQPSRMHLHLELGKALEAAADIGVAKYEYERFLDAWKNADADAPQLLEVRSRLSALEPR